MPGLNTWMTAAANVPALFRCFSVHFDSDFFAEFAQSLDPCFTTAITTRRPSQVPSIPLIHVLCNILDSTPLLQSLSLRLSHPSAWKHFAYKTRGVSIAKSFQLRLQLASTGNTSVSLPHLTHIRLDGLQDIAPLLQIAPNLSHLTLRMIEGFDSSACAQFLADLHGSNLKHLSLSPRSLHLPDGPSSTAPGVEQLEEIGAACPSLESLDLRVKGYSEDALPFVSLSSQSSFLVSCRSVIHF